MTNANFSIRRFKAAASLKLWESRQAPHIGTCIRRFKAAASLKLSQ